MQQAGEAPTTPHQDCDASPRARRQPHHHTDSASSSSARVQLTPNFTVRRNPARRCDTLCTHVLSVKTPRNPERLPCNEQWSRDPETPSLSGGDGHFGHVAQRLLFPPCIANSSAGQPMPLPSLTRSHNTRSACRKSAACLRGWRHNCQHPHATGRCNRMTAQPSDRRIPILAAVHAPQRVSSSSTKIARAVRPRGADSIAVEQADLPTAHTQPHSLASWPACGCCCCRRKASGAQCPRLCPCCCCCCCCQQEVAVQLPCRAAAARRCCCGCGCGGSRQNVQKGATHQAV